MPLPTFITDKLTPREIIPPLILATLVGYFLFHAIYDRQGLMALVNANRKLDERKQELSDLQAERTALERRVALLRSDSLDLDLLDERARAMLGYSAPNEVIVLLKEE